ncbi:MAG: L-aspartate oxidase, partial [candidate division WOR-3 bacterium]
WDGAGIVRSNARLSAALKEVSALSSQVETITPLTPSLIELKNMLTVATLIIQSALLRNESRGLHYKEDYPNVDDEHFLCDTILYREQSPQ